MPSRHAFRAPEPAGIAGVRGEIRHLHSPSSDRGRSPLARLELACQLLAEARSLDEVKAIADMAEAARVYARQARLGLEAQNDAAEVRLRAERRAGELLAQLELDAGGRPRSAKDRRSENLLPPVTGFSPPVRLDDLHITRRQSSQWQQMARVPEPVFEEHLRTTRSRKRELSSAGVLELARRHRIDRDTPLAPVMAAEELSSSTDRFDVADAAALPWPDGSVDLIVSSPPYALDVPYRRRRRGRLPALARVSGALAGRDAARQPSRVGAPVPQCAARPGPGRLGAVSADAVRVARAAGWQFRTWILWDKLQAGAGTDRGSIDSAPPRM